MDPLLPQQQNNTHALRYGSRTCSWFANMFVIHERDFGFVRLEFVKNGLCSSRLVFVKPLFANISTKSMIVRELFANNFLCNIVEFCVCVTCYKDKHLCSVRNVTHKISLLLHDIDFMCVTNYNNSI